MLWCSNIAAFVIALFWDIAGRLKERFRNLWQRRPRELLDPALARLALPSNSDHTVINNARSLTELTIEILADAGLYTPPEGQLFMDLISEIEGEVSTTKTLGPFTRKSDFVWTFAGGFEISSEVTSLKFEGYVRQDQGQTVAQLGSVTVDNLSVYTQRWSGILRDEDNRATSKIVAHISGISEDPSNNAEGSERSDNVVGGGAQLPSPAFLCEIGLFFLNQFEKTGELDNVETALEIFKQCLLLTPDGDLFKPVMYNNLGISFNSRFERTGTLSDLKEAVENERKAVLLMPDGHAEKPLLLTNLGNSLHRWFDQTGSLADLEEAIDYLRQAVSLTPDGHPRQPHRLCHLGISFHSRFQRMGNLSDLQEAIEYQRRAVTLTPDGHHNKPAHLSNLGISLCNRFQRTGALGDLEEAMKIQQEAVSLTPDGHLAKHAWLSNLGNCFLSRFQTTGALCDLAEAIENHRKAVLLIPDGHPDKPSCLSSLGSSFRSRFERTRSLSDVEEAIKSQQQAVSLTHDGHPDKPTWFDNLATSFQCRFEQMGLLSDLEEAIENRRQAVLLTPGDHLARPLRIGNLGISLCNRFERTGLLTDLEEAIENQRLAMLLTPNEHSCTPALLNNLGNSLCRRYERTGVLTDLEEAIEFQRRSVSLTGDEDPDKPSRLSNLGHSFHCRFKLTGVLSDVEEAIKSQRQAVLLTPDGSSVKSAWLCNLGNSLFSRFAWMGTSKDLDEAIKVLRQALLLAPDRYPYQPAVLNNLGNSLQSQFALTGAPCDLEETIEIQREAVLLTPDGHPEKPSRLHNLGNSLSSRFNLTGFLSDLDDAIENHRQSVLLTPDEHPNKALWFDNLGTAFQARFAETQALLDLKSAISYFRLAATSSTGLPMVRARSSRSWARLLHRANDSTSSLEAYRNAIGLLPQIAWIGDPISVRHSKLTDLEDLPREAAAFALDAGQPDLALELLEQGRSIVWNQLLDLRSAVHDLREAHPSLYEEFTLVSRQLQGAAIRDHALGLSFDRSSSLEEETQRHHRLAEKWDSLVRHIRLLPGFGDFLLPKKISSLQKAAESGPVVIINVHQSRCDALALVKGEDSARHIPLPDLSYAHVEELLSSLKKDIASSLIFRRGDRARRLIRRGGTPLVKILSLLFSSVVRPILQGLDMMIENPDSSDLPRIWWCPTGPLTFLPIHAAGMDIPGGRDEVSNYVVSSYIPTVNALLESRGRIRRPFSQLVGIAMINSPSQRCLNPLPNARLELEKIGDLLTADYKWSFISLQDTQATTERVLTEMANCSWVHFACHASQDTGEPTQSSLWLHDGPLSIKDLISRRFENADLAFLSACQTAAGDEKKSDEAMHITAAMLGAGYRSIIGTMWSIPDHVAPILASNFYEYLLLGGEPDSEQAARALHKSVKELQKSGEHSLYSWVPFVHYGL